MAYDAVKMKDWQISEAAEKNMPTFEEWQERLGLQKDEVIPYGRLCKLDFMKIIERLKDKPDGKYIEVGKTRAERWRCPQATLWWTYHEYQRDCSRRRKRPSHPHD